MIGVSYLLRTIVALAVAWWLGGQVLGMYQGLAERVGEIRERMDHHGLRTP